VSFFVYLDINNPAAFSNGMLKPFADHARHNLDTKTAIALTGQLIEQARTPCRHQGIRPSSVHDKNLVRADLAAETTAYGAS
jgi:hypothetical protein